MRPFVVSVSLSTVLPGPVPGVVTIGEVRRERGADDVGDFSGGTMDLSNGSGEF